MMVDMEWGVYKDGKRMMSFISKDAAEYYAKSYNTRYNTGKFSARKMDLMNDELFEGRRV